MASSDPDDPRPPRPVTEGAPPRGWIAGIRTFVKRNGVVLTFAGTIVASVVGLGKYIGERIERSSAAQRDLAFNIKREFQKPFYERQMDLCLEASSAAASLATTRDEGRASEARDNFWRLYWGPLAAVERSETGQPGVETAMVHYGKLLELKCPHGACPSTDLQHAAISIAHECRRLFAEAWQAPIVAVPARQSRLSR